MPRSGLSCFVSAEMLKKGRVFSVVRLPWAQEVSGSNPDAPTNQNNRAGLNCWGLGSQQYTRECHGVEVEPPLGRDLARMQENSLPICVSNKVANSGPDHFRLRRHSP